MAGNSRAPNSIPTSGQKIYTPPTVAVQNPILTFFDSLQQSISRAGDTVIRGAEIYFDINELKNQSKRRIQNDVYDRTEETPVLGGVAISKDTMTILTVAGIGLAAIGIILLVRK
jgi:hypothetical protein